jgi:hypothetical protein
MKIPLIVCGCLLLLYLALRFGGAWYQTLGVRRAMDQLRREAPARGLTVSFAALERANLPPVVRAYLRRSLPDATRFPRIASLGQRGGFRLKAGAPFMAMRAGQLFSVQAPGLVWHADLSIVPGLPIEVRDSLLDGRGLFGGRVFGLFTVAAGEGPDVDEATLVRYLSESVWFPYALLPSDWLRWEAVDQRSARALLTDRGRTVAGVFSFDAESRPIAFDAKRPRDVHGAAVPTPWHVDLGAHARMAGVELPTSGAVSWELPEGKFEYGRFEVVELAFAE